MQSGSERNIRKDKALKDEERVEDYFEKLGYKVAKLDIDGECKMPDFLISNSRGEGCFVLEIKSQFNQVEFVKKDNLLKEVYKNFNPNINTPWSFYIRKFHIMNVPQDQILEWIRRIENRINQEIMQKAIKGYRLEQREFLFFTREDNEDNTNRQNEIQIFAMGTKLRNADMLRNLIKKASKKFANVFSYKLPTVLIVCNHNFFLKIEHFEQAFHGDYTVSFSRSEGTINEIYFGKKKSVQPNKNTRLSAICLCDWDRGGNFSVFHNPYADIPLPLEYFALPGNKQQILRDGSLEWQYYD